MIELLELVTVTYSTFAVTVLLITQSISWQHGNPLSYLPTLHVVKSGLRVLIDIQFI